MTHVTGAQRFLRGANSAGRGRSLLGRCRGGERGPLAWSGFALRMAAPSGWISRADGLQGAVAEPLGIALTRFRKCDDALRKRRANGVVMVGGGAERGQRRAREGSKAVARTAVGQREQSRESQMAQTKARRSHRRRDPYGT